MRFSFVRDFCGAPECAAPIIWATDEHDSWLAVDYDPHPDGNVLIMRRSGARVPLAKFISPTFPVDSSVALRLTHDSSCGHPNIEPSPVAQKEAA